MNPSRLITGAIATAGAAGLAAAAGATVMWLAPPSSASALANAGPAVIRTVTETTTGAPTATETTNPCPTATETTKPAPTETVSTNPPPTSPGKHHHYHHQR